MEKLTEVFVTVPFPEWSDYKISNLGNVLSRNGKLMKLPVTKKGYYKIRLWRSDGKKSFFVHRLVATAFINNPLNYPQINHKDTNKKNNIYSNLEWCNNSHNIKHAHANGLINLQGENHPGHKINEQQVMDIKSRFKAPRKLLADQYNVSIAAIKDIRSGKSWSHLNPSI